MDYLAAVVTVGLMLLIVVAIRDHLRLS